MANLMDDIKSQVLAQASKSPHRSNNTKAELEVDTGQSHGTEGLVIEQTLNKLFYADPNLEEEVKFLQIKRGTEKVGRVGLHASAIIVGEKEFCYREQVLSLFYQQLQGNNVPIGLKRIFAEGDAIHEKWQRMFIRGGLGTSLDMDRTRFNKKYSLSYSPDAVIKIGQKQYVVEIKSVNTFQFKKMQSHPSAKKQLMLYMWLTGIHDGFVLCEDKNTQDIKVFVYHLDMDFIAPYIERLEAIQTYKERLLDEHKMPKRICDSAVCKRAGKCNLKEACWNIGGGRVRL